MTTGRVHWTLAEVADAVGGSVVGPAGLVVSSVGTDSRDVASGSLFVAVSGERFDGHEFAGAALGGGAAAVVVDPSRVDGDVRPRVEVRDPGTALRDLAVLRRSELDVPVVAVTGSTGKTSTKDLLGAVLPGAWASPASYNNEIGVPLTVLGMPPGADYLVAEVGSRGTGHISWLMPCVRPHVAVITNLGVVHLETFGTREKVAAAKWELVEGLEPGGTAVLPVDEPRLSRSHAGSTTTFGPTRAADVWFEDVRTDDRGRPSFTLGEGGERRRIRMSMAGKHQAYNAAAAAAAARVLGIDLDAIAARLEQATGSPGRMEIHHGPVTIVNDAYNANPDSMESALRTVAAMPGRHLAVVGLMAELGAVTDEEHARIGALMQRLDYAGIFVVGDDPGLADAAGPNARRLADIDEARRALEEEVRPGDVVLVKASHAVGLEPLARWLVEESGS